LEWYSNNLKSVFEKWEKLYIEKAVVNKDYRRREIGRFMYESVFADNPEKLLYSFIAKKPSFNITSLKFHIKIGFVEAAKFEANNFLGINNYESVMLMKCIHEK